MDAVDSSPDGALAATQPAPLGVDLRNRLRKAHEDGASAGLQDLAAEAVEFGCVELAEQATRFLQHHLK
eukprot:14272833-Alexandrium_andersonii.AAC.1